MSKEIQQNQLLNIEKLLSEGKIDLAIKIADDASEKGVFVHTIGMGSVNGGPIPIKNRYGKLKGYRKDNWACH